MSWKVQKSLARCVEALLRTDCFITVSRGDGNHLHAAFSRQFTSSAQRTRFLHGHLADLIAPQILNVERNLSCNVEPSLLHTCSVAAHLGRRVAGVNEDHCGRLRGEWLGPDVSAVRALSMATFHVPTGHTAASFPQRVLQGSTRAQ